MVGKGGGVCVITVTDNRINTVDFADIVYVTKGFKYSLSGLILKIVPMIRKNCLRKETNLKCREK